MKRRHIIASYFALAITVLIVQVAIAQTPELMLFGGENHKIFLGCLNCSKYDSSSVCNKYGNYGSRYNSESIWNRYGDYGSRYSSYSPWNKYASNPPVVVDREGNFYGYFTANRYEPKRTRIKFFLIFLDNVDEVNEDLEKAREYFCNE
jgi:hypothetical protein